MTVLGVDAYHYGPQIFGGPLAVDIPNIWQTTPAPYGPVFLSLAADVTSITGESAWLGVIGMRVLALIGVALMIFAIPRMARTGRRRGAVRHLARRAQPAGAGSPCRRRAQRRAHDRPDDGRADPGDRAPPGRWRGDGHSGRPRQGPRRTGPDLHRPALGGPALRPGAVRSRRARRRRHRHRDGCGDNRAGRHRVRLDRRAGHTDAGAHLDLAHHRPGLLVRCAGRALRARHGGSDARLGAAGRPGRCRRDLPVHAAQAPDQPGHGRRPRPRRGAGARSGGAPVVPALGHRPAGGRGHHREGAAPGDLLLAGDDRAGVPRRGSAERGLGAGLGARRACSSSAPPGPWPTWTATTSPGPSRSRYAGWSPAGSPPIAARYSSASR